MTTDPRPRKRINLALQGGGAHGGVHLGRAGSPAGGRPARHRRHLRHQRRGDERGGARLRPRARGAGRGARDAGPLLGPRRRARPLQPGAADAAGPHGLHRRHELLAGLAVLRRSVADGVALCRESRQHQSAGRGAGRGGRFRLAARAPHRAAVRLRHQREERQDPRVRLPRDHGQGDHGVGLPAVRLPGGGDRRRELLGRRLHGQPAFVPADLPHRLRGCADRPDQPDPGRRGAENRTGRSSTA